MQDFISGITNLRLMSREDAAISAVDILIVAFLLYRLLMLVRGTRAWRIIIGLLIFFFVLLISEPLKLHTLHWLLVQASQLGAVALAVIFLPELRQVAEGVGKLDRWTPLIGAGERPRSQARTVEELVAAISELSSNRVGALIVIERTSSLAEIVANGVELNAKVSAPLLVSIFYDQNPLHDGAVIIQGDMVLAAACRLPLSESSRIDSTLHMRHRAAVGMTEGQDCLSVVVSEERGTIRVAREGKLRIIETTVELRELLNSELRDDKPADERPKRVHRERKPRVEVRS